MSSDNTFFFYIVDKNWLRNEIENVLQSLAVVAQDMNFVLGEHKMMEPPEPIRNMPAYISKEVEFAKRGELGRVNFFLDGSRYYSASLYIDLAYDFFVLDASYDFFGPSERITEALELFNICKEVFVRFNAIYAYGTMDPGEWPDERRINDIRNGNMDTLFPYNFLSADLISSIGRERLLSIPAWRIDDTKNGGLMLIMEPNFYFGISSEPYEQAVAMLNLKRFIKG